MATLKNVTISDTGYLRLPVGTGSQRPAEDSNSIGAMRVNSESGKLEYWDGAAWELNTIAFPYRQIISASYTQGGYKNSVAWNNVNKTFHSTDTTVNLGDGAIERAHNYQWGANSKEYAYVFGASNAHAQSSNYVIAYNMTTEQNATDISRTMSGTRFRFGGVFQEHNFAWITGGGAAQIEKYNMVTKTLLGNTASSYSTGETWGMSTETYGIFYRDSSNASNWQFATETLTTRSGTTPSNSHQQKSVQSKWAYAWAGNEGSYSGGSNLRRTNWTTNSTSGTVSKPVGNCGEENFDMGQDHQYMLGQYNGLQNNISWRFNYATESGFQGGSSLEPKGKAGMSSAVCSWTD